MKYWHLINNDQKNQIKQLVNNGKLAFSGGEYISGDQSGCTYEDLIGQLVIGQQFLKENLNFIPKVSMNFLKKTGGYSMSYSYLLMKSGIQALFIDPIRGNEKINEFYWKFTNNTNEKALWTHINNEQSSNISPFFYFPDVSQILTSQNDEIANQFLEYLQNLESQQINYLGNQFFNMINITSEELKSDSVFIILEELVKIINKVEDLRKGNYHGSFISPQLFLQQIILQQSKNINYPIIHNIEFWQPINEKGSIASGVYSNNPRIRALINNNLQIWRNLEKFIVLETLKTKKINNNSINEIEEIQKEMEQLEKLLLFMQSSQLINQLENAYEVLQAYLLEIKQKRNDVYSRIARIINQKAIQQYDESTINFRLYNPSENELYELMKRNNQASFILSFINYGEQIQKLIKFQVPFSTLKILSIKNEEQPIDIICEQQDKCTLYLYLKLDGWSETMIKMVPSNQKQEIYPVNKAGKIGFWRDDMSAELGMEQQIIRYKHCKGKKQNNNNQQQQQQQGQQPQENMEMLNQLAEGLQNQVQQELDKHGVNIEQNLKDEILRGVYSNVLQRMKDQGQKLKDQAEKSVQGLQQAQENLGQKIKERLGRFILAAIRSEVQRDLEDRELVDGDSNSILKQAIGNAVINYIQKQELQEKLENEDKVLLQVEIFHDVLNKIDVQEWIMTEKIIDKMEAKTGEKVKEKQREQISEEVRKELMAQAVGKGIKDINEKIESKVNQYIQKIQQNQKEEVQEPLEQQEEKQDEQQQDEQQEEVEQVQINQEQQEKVEQKQELIDQLKYSKEKILELKNELVLLKKKKQKLMVKGEVISDELVEKILQKEQDIQELSENVRLIEQHIEQSKQQKQNNKKLQKKQNQKLQNLAAKEKKEEKELEQVDGNCQVLVAKNEQNVVQDVDEELKEEEIEKKEDEINALKSKLSEKELQYENQVKTAEELREEINEEKNRLLEEERELKEIQMGKLQEKMEDERTTKQQLLQRINELGQLKSSMQELQEKEQQVQQAVSVFAELLNEKQKNEQNIKDEEDITKQAFNVLSSMLNNMEQEEKEMANDQEKLTNVENELEQERDKLASMVRQKEINLIQFQTQKDQLQQKISKLPQRNQHSFLEMKRIVNDQYVCIEESFFINFMQYNCGINEQCSDQINFRPQGLPTDMFDEDPEIIFYQGQIIGQIIIKYPNIKAILTLSRDMIDQQFIDVEAIIEKIHYEDNNIQSKEIVLAITSMEIENNGKFITDSNGYFLNEREYKQEGEKRKIIAQNYYPASIVSIKDEQSKISMNVNLQESLGVTSQKQGQIEIMFNRILSKTQIPSNLTFALSFNDNSINFPHNIRTIEKLIQTPLVRFFSETSNPIFTQNQKVTSKSLELPDYINLQFRLIKKNKILVHLTNLNPTDSYQIQLFESYTNSISNLFTQLTGMMLKFESIQETSLTGNQDIHEIEDQKNQQDVAEGIINLNPMETRAFVFKF